MTRACAWALSALVALGAGSGAVAQNRPEYRIVKSVRLGSPDRWDYLAFDAASHTVYVSHGDRVTVVDGRSGRILGEVKGLPGGTHGVVALSALRRGFTDDGRNGQVAAFNLRTLEVSARIKVDPGADAIAFDPTSGHVFVVSGAASALSVIDPRTLSVVARVSIGGDLEFAVAGANGKLYVNGAQRREIVRIDTASNQVDARWPVPECESPHGLAIDTLTHRLFVSCENERLLAVDADTGTVVARAPIGRGTDAAAFDPRRRLVFSSNGRDGTLSVLQEKDAQTLVPVATVRTAPTARTMTLDPQSGRLYLVAADLNVPGIAVSVSPAAGNAVPARRPGPIVPGSVKLLFLDPQ